MHRLHDEGAKITHMTGHMLHERSFWGILAILAVLTLLFTLIIMFGDEIPNYEMAPPTPYGYF